MRILPQSVDAGALRKMWNQLGGRFEQDCLLCAATSVHGIVCPACAADLPRLRQPCCRRCARPLASGDGSAQTGVGQAAANGGELCGRCLSKPPHYDATLAAFHYGFPLDKLIHSFKYGHRLALGPFFGQQLAALVTHPPADLIVPLPLHAERLRERGFNQALEIARPLGRAWKVPIDARVCRRTRDTPAQASLALRERVKNMRGAFYCSSDLTDRRIILVDDVMTSGASLDECARTLKLHGASHVTALVVARALAK